MGMYNDTREFRMRLMPLRLSRVTHFVCWVFVLKSAAPGYV